MKSQLFLLLMAAAPALAVEIDGNSRPDFRVGQQASSLFSTTKDASQHVLMAVTKQTTIDQITTVVIVTLVPAGFMLKLATDGNALQAPASFEYSDVVEIATCNRTVKCKQSWEFSLRGEYVGDYKIQFLLYQQELQGRIKKSFSLS